MTERGELDYYYTNKLSRIMLISFEEIIGNNGMNDVLNNADLRYLIDNYPPDDYKPGMKFEEISRIHLSLEKLFGSRGGRGLALRSGRAFFKYGLREFGEDFGVTDTDFRLLPLEKKILTAIELLAKLFNDHSGQSVTVKDISEKIFWIVERCPLCWNRHTNTQVCHMNVGMMQECLSWISSAKTFHIEEIKCIAKGDADCTLAIDKIAIN